MTVVLSPTLVSDDYAPQRAGHASLPGPTTAPLVTELCSCWSRAMEQLNLVYFGPLTKSRKVINRSFAHLILIFQTIVSGVLTRLCCLKMLSLLEGGPSLLTLPISEMLTYHTVTKDIFVWIVGAWHSVNNFNCSVYLLTYLHTYVRAHSKYTSRQLISSQEKLWIKTVHKNVWCGTVVVERG